VRAPIAQIADRREGRPFGGNRVLQASFTVVGVMETAHGLSILRDELTGLELGVDHDGVGRGVPICASRAIFANFYSTGSVGSAVATDAMPAGK
jgi:hypothetical protein